VPIGAKEEHNHRIHSLLILAFCGPEIVLGYRDLFPVCEFLIPAIVSGCG